MLARRPEVALVDELAHTNVPGTRHGKRWEDVRDLLDAGIDVITTVNIQHLESVNDVVERITGVRQRETIPDAVVRAADQIELVDMAPEALRRRMAHGNIYGADRIDAALANYFRPGNLAALRELALLWVADRVDDALEEYRERHGITEPWETRERVVVAVTGAPSADDLIRRAARIASRARGELLGVHVRSDDGLVGDDEGHIGEQRRLLEEMGGTYHETAGSDVAAALVDFARAENATQLVLGASQRSRVTELVRGSVINRVVRLSGPIDVHVISHRPDDEADGDRTVPRVRRHPATLAPRRRAAGWALAALGLPALSAVLVPMRDDVSLPSVLLLFLLLVVTVATVGGLAPALATALVGFLVVNRLFTPPLHTWTIAEAENLLALAIFLVVATVVSALVAAAARRTAEATRAAAEASTLASLAGTIASPDPLPVLVDHLQHAFGLAGAALLRKVDGTWQAEASAGEAPASPAEADQVRPLGGDLVLAVRGSDLAAEDRRVLNAFVAQLAAAIDRRRVGAQAARAAALAEADELRSALLQAVSHDLRTPLAGIKASASSLRQPDIDWSDEDRDEFLATIEDETDRLTALVVNLLDMSRIQAGAVVPALRPVGLEEVVPAAVAGLGPRAAQVTVDVPESLRPVKADPALLERAVANLVENAVAHSPSGGPVRGRGGRGRRPRPHPGDRPRTRYRPRRARTGLPAVPAHGRQPVARRRRGPRARGGPGVHPGDGRRPHDRRHPRRRDDHDPRAGGGRVSEPSEPVGRGRRRGEQHPRARRRRRAADPRAPSAPTCGRATTRSTSPPAARRRSPSPPVTAPTP